MSLFDTLQRLRQTEVLTSIDNFLPSCNLFFGVDPGSVLSRDERGQGLSNATKEGNAGERLTVYDPALAATKVASVMSSVPG